MFGNFFPITIFFIIYFLCLLFYYYFFMFIIIFLCLLFYFLFFMFIILFFIFYVYDFTDIDECKGNRSCHVNATCVNTIGSHVCQCHAGYTGNGRNCTGESNIFATCTIFRAVLHVTFNYSAAPFSRVARH